MIEERHSRDEKKRNNRNENFHDTSVDPTTISYGTAVREKVGSVENNKETKIIPTKLDRSNIFAIEKIQEAKDHRKLGVETEKDPMEKQTHDKILSANDNNLIKSNDSKQQESYDINYKSLV